MGKAVFFVPSRVCSQAAIAPARRDVPAIATTGTTPHCIVTAQCVGTNTGVNSMHGHRRQLVCYENDIAGKSVTFKNEFCDSSASKESVLESANDALRVKL